MLDKMRIVHMRDFKGKESVESGHEDIDLTSPIAEVQRNLVTCGGIPRPENAPPRPRP